MAKIEVFYPTGRDLNSWEAAYSAGKVPDRWPYGLNRLASDPSFEVSGVEAQPLKALRVANAFIRGREETTLSTAAAIAWDEDLALRLVVERRKQAKMAGVIWLTDRIVRSERSAKDVLLKSFLPRMNGLWALSRPQIDIVQDWLGSDSPTVDFLRFGIDQEFFSQWNYPEKPMVLSIGRDRDRDPKTLFEAFEEIVRLRPDVEVVAQSSSALPAPSGVRIVPSLTHSELRDYYRRASVVVVATRPNVHVSGMTVALESMSTSRPVVMCDTAGMRDYVEDGVSGLLFPCGDSKGLAAGVLSLLDDPLEAKRIGLNGRSRVEAMHTTELMAQDLKRIVLSRLS